jgi:glyoxylase-like metal-dependent hydrolase (beta-lactamase superfamily II)
VWGTRADDAPVFANAEYYMAAAEWDFWMNEDLPSQAPEPMRPMVVTTQAKLGPTKDRLTMLKPGDEIVGGVRMLDTPGHTPGHASFEVPGDGGLIILGDVINSTAIGFAHPEWHYGFDADPEQARQLVEAAHREARDVRGTVSWLERRGFVPEEVVLHGAAALPITQSPG